MGHAHIQVRDREQRRVLGAEVVHDMEVLVGLCGSRQREHHLYLVSDPDSVFDSEDKC